MTAVPADLRAALEIFAERERVLVAVDFDGVLAPLVDQPMRARAAAGGLEALHAAAALSGVHVAVVSGRDLDTLSTLTGIGRDDRVTLVGSHGGQSSLDALSSASLLDDDARARLAAATTEVEAILARHPQARIEHKPAAVAVHTRGVDPEAAGAALAEALEVPDRHTGVHALPGKDVVELTVLETDKGSALCALARELATDATTYLGDDVTDERAFAALDPAAGDLTVKVGDGPTLARHRLPGVADVVAFLELFVALRTA